MADDINDMPRLEYHTPNLDLDWLRTQGELAVACANEIAILRRRLLRYREGAYYGLDEQEVRSIVPLALELREALRRKVIVKNPHARWTMCELCRSEWLDSEGREKHKPGCLAAPTN
jgi:hypothetical protein